MRRGRKKSGNPMGSVVRAKRSSGDVWAYRWKDENGKYRSVVFGTVKDFKNVSLARDEARRQSLFEKHMEPVRTARKGATFGQLADRYQKEKMPERHSTQHSYLSWLRNHIIPKWGSKPIVAVDPGSVELWLSDLPLAQKSKAHIRGLMSVLFDQAMKWQLIPIGRNPMTLVSIRGGSRRRARPRVLTQEQFSTLMARISEDHVKTIAMIAMCIGLRLSEVLALQWGDINWATGTISISRGIVQGRIGETKTEYSDAPAPMDPALAEVLKVWKSKTDATESGPWLFASPFKGYKVPYFPTAIRRKILAAAKSVGMEEILQGEPTKIFRHSYRSWLGTTDAPVAVIKDLMRHADIRTTFNVYGNGMPEPMRGANSKVVEMVFAGKKKSG